MDYPGEKLLIRLWETIAEKGIGTLLIPWQIRREGRARIDVRREAMLVIAQAEHDVEDIRTGRRCLVPSGRLEALPEPAIPQGVGEGSAVGHSAAIVSRNMIAEGIREEINVTKAILGAVAELEADSQEPPEQKIVDDWLFRWRESASTVSTEELQNLWGRVLAGEIKSPGSFSLRTLEFLKNLSREEALEIASLSRFVVVDSIFRGDQQILDSAGITFGFLLRMQELGILSGVEAIGVSLTLKSSETEQFRRGLLSHDRTLVVTHEDVNKEIRLNVYPLTSLGQQVLTLGSFESHEAYLRSVGKAIRGQGFKVLIARYQGVTRTEGRYFDAQELVD